MTLKDGNLKEGDLCEIGSQLRPHVVWFGEAVPAIEEAARVVSRADIFMIIGTSMNVYPAAGLINYVPTLPPFISSIPMKFLCRSSQNKGNPGECGRRDPYIKRGV